MNIVTNLRIPFFRALSLLLALTSGFVARAQEDDRPVVDASTLTFEKPADGSKPTFWIAGDSTVRSNNPLRGWGSDVDQFFDTTKINVVNRAIGGRSSRTFYTEGRWQSILDELKKGDWVIVQFGHNDVGYLDARSKFRGSVKGIGDETEDVTLANGTVETVHSYGWYLKTYVRTAREKGANVILCSPIPHKRFNADGSFQHDWDKWRQWVETCAQQTGAYYIDLSEIIGNAYDKLDHDKIESFFGDKGTHTNADGSLFNAKAVISGLKGLPGAPLDSYLNDKAAAIAPAHL